MMAGHTKRHRVTNLTFFSNEKTTGNNIVKKLIKR